jgi:hypothetical protein
MKWCRLYNETVNDPKLGLIAQQAGVAKSHVVAVWVSMLCHASDNAGARRGTIEGWNDALCAFNLGIDRAVVFSIRGQMEGFLLDGPRLIAWEKRQKDSDDVAKRVRDHRAKKRAEAKAGNVTRGQNKAGAKQDPRAGNVTLARDGEVAETASSVTETPGNVTETRCNGKRRGEESNSVSASADTAPPAARGGGDPPLDIRAQLWREGRVILERLCGFDARRSGQRIGQWVKQLGDDCAAVLHILREAEVKRPVGDASDWIQASVNQRAERGQPPSSTKGDQPRPRSRIEEQRAYAREEMARLRAAAEARAKANGMQIDGEAEVVL